MAPARSAGPATPRSVPAILRGAASGGQASYDTNDSPSAARDAAPPAAPPRTAAAPLFRTVPAAPRPPPQRRPPPRLAGPVPRLPPRGAAQGAGAPPVLPSPESRRGS